MKILNGKIIQEHIKSVLTERISQFVVKPHLAIIQIGTDKASSLYIAKKVAFAHAIGARTTVIALPDTSTEQDIVNTIVQLNFDRDVHGVIVQLPLPKHVVKSRVIDAIDPIKDVDGLTTTNTAKMFRNESGGIVPATTRGIFTLLDHYAISVSGKHVAIVGRSNLVGRPTAIALLNRDATVTVCHTHTKKLGTILKKADIVVSAIGKGRFLTPSHFTKNYIVIDVGISIDDSGKMIGDVSLGNTKVRAITPVPGGIGPMTVASLFQNLCDAYEQQV